MGGICNVVRSYFTILDINSNDLLGSDFLDFCKIEQDINNHGSGRLIICILGPGDFTTTGHFIVLTGVDENGGIIVNDPNSIINSKKSWDIEQLMHQIRNLWSYAVE